MRAPAKPAAGSSGLLAGPRHAAACGVELLAAALEQQGVAVERVDWRPPADAAARALERIALHAPSVAAANDRAVARVQEARPLLVGVTTAGDAIPGMERNTILHAGPPIEWERMAGPVRGAIAGAAVYEGLARDPREAAELAASGAFELAPCHERGAVGPMAGVVSASMPVWIVENEVLGNRAYCTFNEGLGKVLRYGAHDGAVLERLRWLADVLAPTLAAALRRLGQPPDLRALIAQALQMGDECHNRNRAGTSLFLRELIPALLELDEPSSVVSDCARFVARNDHFFLNLAMPAAKACADAAAGVPASTIVTAMARNGTDFGIRVSGTGERWFTGPAQRVEGLYFPGYGPEDASPDLGDSTITETVGLGGFAMAAAPAITGFVGGSPEQALEATRLMYGITWADSEAFQVPAMAFRGTPTGIDCREVVASSVLPVINTGIAHREPGVGQVGAGLVHPPMEAFTAAVETLAGTA
jgi:hypothetical protein